MRDCRNPGSFFKLAERLTRPIQLETWSDIYREKRKVNGVTNSLQKSHQTSTKIPKYFFEIDGLESDS